MLYKATFLMLFFSLTLVGQNSGSIGLTTHLLFPVGKFADPDQSGFGNRGIGVGGTVTYEYSLTAHSSLGLGIGYYRYGENHNSGRQSYIAMVPVIIEHSYYFRRQSRIDPFFRLGVGIVSETYAQTKPSTFKAHAAPFFGSLAIGMQSPVNERLVLNYGLSYGLAKSKNTYLDFKSFDAVNHIDSNFFGVFLQVKIKV
ncbi:hypothetical protein K1X84_15480 [bacterium]|nr:hypothetical protein [bacterium]